MSSWDWLSKFVLIGDASTGKSSLLVRLTENRFLADPDPTVGVEFGSYIVTIETGERIKCQCWDTAGSETFRSITRSYYRGAAGALLVYNITHRPSFLHIGDWLRDIREHAEENVSIILVGNMSDLCADEDAEEAAAAATAVSEEGGDASAASTGKDDQPPAQSGERAETAATAAPASPKKKAKQRRRQVTREEAAKYAEQEGIMFVETSAKTGDNVEQAFERAARDIHARFRATPGVTSRSGLAAGTSRPGVIAASIDGSDVKPGRGCCTVQ